MKKTLFFIAAALCLNSAIAQKGSFEGKVVYELSFPGMELDANTAAMMPKESSFFIKDTKSRMEMSMGMGMSTVTLSDSKDKSTTLLYDMMGNKMAIKMTEEEMKKKNASEKTPTVKQLPETKEIAGYKCKKAEISLNDAENTVTTVYYCPELSSKNLVFGQDHLKGIDGFPMEFETKQQGMTMRFAAKQVTKEAVADSKFTVPSDYKPMTMDEFSKMMSGQ